MNCSCMHCSGKHVPQNALACANSHNFTFFYMWQKVKEENNKTDPNPNPASTNYKAAR